VLEEYLIRYCAPTLGNLKVGSLFAYPCTVPEQLLSHVSPLNSLLNAMDVFIEPLKYGKTSSLIYVYRKRLLDVYLSFHSISISNNFKQAFYFIHPLFPQYISQAIKQYLVAAAFTDALLIMIFIYFSP
jgi:hypothetical protein